MKVKTNVKAGSHSSGDDFSINVGVGNVGVNFGTAIGVGRARIDD
jgi:hypothetical protein